MFVFVCAQAAARSELLTSNGIARRLCARIPCPSPSVHALAGESLTWIHLNKCRPREELYDLQEDPDETNNLADLPHHADRKARLQEELSSWMASQADNDPVALEMTVKARKPSSKSGFRCAARKLVNNACGAASSSSSAPVMAAAEAMLGDELPARVGTGEHSQGDQLSLVWMCFGMVFGVGMLTLFARSRRRTSAGPAPAKPAVDERSPLLLANETAPDIAHKLIVASVLCSELSAAVIPSS